MQKFILAGCDLHDKTMLLKIAEDCGEMVKRSFSNDAGGREAMIAELKSEPPRRQEGNN